MSSIAILAENIVASLGLVLVLSAIPLGVSALVGLGLSILQTVLQIQDSSFTFIGRAAAVLLVLGVFSEWIGAELLMFAGRCFEAYTVVLAR